MALRNRTTSLDVTFAVVSGIVVAAVLNHWAYLYNVTIAETDVLAALDVATNSCLWHALRHPFTLDTSGLGLCATGIGFLLPFLGIMGTTFTNGNYRPGEEHGSARWMTKREMRLFGDWDDLDNNVILSRNARMAISTSKFNMERDRNKNVLIIGGPGSGKTRYFIKPNLMQLNANVWITDPKGMLPREVGQMYIDAGYDVRFFNTIDFSLSMHFNPFAYIDDVNDIPPLIDCLVNNVKPPDSGHSNDPFWEQSEKELLVALVAYMFEALPLERRTFRTLNRLLGMIEVSEDRDNVDSPLDILFQAWETGAWPHIPARRKISDENRAFIDEGYVKDVGHPDSYAVRIYKKFKVGAGKTLKSILMSVNADLWQFDLPAVLDLTDYDEMDLDSLGGLVEEDLRERAKTDPGILKPSMGARHGVTSLTPNGQRKSALFVAMDDQNSTFYFLISVLTYLGIARLKSYADNKGNGKLPIPMQFYLDEFANIGKINDFDKVITTIRSRRMAATLVIQSLSQLDSVYGEKEAGIIKNGCDTWVYIGGCKDDTCEPISKMIGNQTVSNKNGSKTYAERRSSSVSEQILQRPLIDAAEVSKLSRWKCIVIISNTNAFLDDKYLVEEHPRYRMIDPGHSAGKSPKGVRYPKADYDDLLDVAAWRRKIRAGDVWRASGTLDATVDEELSEGLIRCTVERITQAHDASEVERYLESLTGSAARKTASAA